MTDNYPDLRIPLPERDDLSPAGQAAWDHVASSRGRDTLPNVFRALANNVGALENAASVGEFIRFQADLDDTMRELAILTTAQENRCAYEWTAHYRIAERDGVSPDLLSAIGTAKIEAEPAPLGPAMRYARLVANSQPVDDETVETLKESLGIEKFVALNILVGYYGMLARFINTMGVPMDIAPEPTPFVVNT
jgi:4-carboxymuconolactone decarboxylase